MRSGSTAKAAPASGRGGVKRCARVVITRRIARVDPYEAPPAVTATWAAALGEHNP